MNRLCAAVGASVALAALAATACTGAGETEPAPAPIEGCVDIRVATNLLPDPSSYTPHGMRVPGGVWLTDGRIHVAWQALRWSDAVTSPLGDNRHPELMVTSFDVRTGDVVETRRYDLLPPHIGFGDSGFGAACGSRDGQFAVAHHWGDLNTSSSDLILVDRLDGPSAPVVATPLPDVSYVCAVGWDGEAFAVHGTGAPAPQGGKQQFVARVGPDGSVLLPFTAYGTATSPCYYHDLGLHIATVPETGLTYGFEAESGCRLIGHDRAGAPLPGTESGPKTIEANGTITVCAGQPALGAGVDGAWVEWLQPPGPVTDDKVIAQRLDLGGDPVGNAFEVRGAPVGLWGAPSPAVVAAHPGAAAWFGGVLMSSMFGAEYDGLALGEPWTFIDASGDSRPLGQQGQMWQAIAVEGEEGAWLAFQEYPSASQQVVRVLRAKRGCVYPTLEKAEREGLE